MAVRDGLTITNVSYDPTREFYEEYNKVFADYYIAEYGKQIKGYTISRRFRKSGTLSS